MVLFIIKWWLNNLIQQAVTLTEVYFDLVEVNSKSVELYLVEYHHYK